MTEYAKIANLFKDEINLANYFDFMEAESAKNALLTLFENDTTELIFLIGDPGVGKTFLIKYLIKELFTLRQIFYYDTPFFDYDQFLSRFILRFSDENISEIQDKKNYATQLARKNKHTIFIDEAQLLGEEQVEFLRTLSDTKAFQIVLTMHKDEGEEILNKKHFKSRKKHIVILNEVKATEIAKYISNVLLKNSCGEHLELFDKKSFNFIQKHTRGNMRAIKRMLQTLFELLDYKKENGLLQEIKLDRCLLTMAAIDVGLIDA